MQLKNLKLVDFRCFKELEMDFDDHLTVFVAPNGCGKTTVLDAISIAFGTFVGEFDAASPKHAHAWDIRRFPVYLESSGTTSDPVAPMVAREFAAKLSITVEAEYEGSNLSWFRELRPGGRTTTKDARAITEKGSRLDAELEKKGNPRLPLLAYYGTGRLWSHKKQTKNKKRHMERSRSYGYTDCLVPDSTYHAFEEWFQRIVAAEREYADQAARNIYGARGQHELYHAHRHAVARAVEEVVSFMGWKELSCNAIERSVVLSSSTDREMPVDFMSDGVRAMVGLVADIAFRCVTLNPHFTPEDVLNPQNGGACKTTEGIVLIDEVDMHLHPSWQQRVLADLQRAFPKIQFIVTTHSPQVLSTIHDRNIRILDVDDSGVGSAMLPPNDPYGKISRVALEDVMKVSAEPPVDGQKKWGEYETLIIEGEYDSEKAHQLRRELEEKFGATDERFLVLDMMIRREKAIRGEA